METAETFREMLLEISSTCGRPDLSGTAPPQLDLSDVDVCGTPGVQLLLSAARTMASQGFSIQFSPISPVIEQAFARFGSPIPFSKSEQTGVSVQ